MFSLLSHQAARPDAAGRAFHRGRSRYVPQMGDHRVALLWPRHVQNVGFMRDFQARVAAYCPACKNMFRIDLEAIIQLRGRSYSLIDQRGPCRLYRCEGKAFFMFLPGENTPFRPLATNAGELARMFAGLADPEELDDEPSPDDHPPRPPRPPRGIDAREWAKASDRERAGLLRRARG